MGRIRELISPVRPSASWHVETPTSANAAVTDLSARLMVRLTVLIDIAGHRRRRTRMSMFVNRAPSSTPTSRDRRDKQAGISVP